MTSRGGLAGKRGTLGNIQNTGPIETEEVTVGGSSQNQTIIKKGHITSVGGTATLNKLVVSGTATFNGSAIFTSEPVDIQTTNLVVKDPTIALGAIIDNSNNQNVPDDTSPRTDRGLLFHYKHINNTDKIGFFGLRPLQNEKYFLYQYVTINANGVITGTPTLGNLKLGDIEATGINLSNSGSNGTITNLADPSGDQDAATKSYVDGKSSPWATSGSDIYYNGGNVGIGTPYALTRLHIADTTGTECKLRLESSSNTYIEMYPRGHGDGRYMWFGYGSATNAQEGKLQLYLAKGTAKSFSIINTNVGIKTASPHCPLQVMGHSGVFTTTGGSQTSFFLRNYPHGGGISNVNVPSGQQGHPSLATTTIYGQYNIVAGSYIVATNGSLTVSDNRIKNNIQDIDDSTALNILRQLKPKTYGYNDVVARGSDEVVGFIAQEVKELIPSAVSIDTRFLPNIYCVSTLGAEGVVEFDTSKMIIGDNVTGRISLRDKNDGEQILEVGDYTSISTGIQVSKDISEYIGDNNEIFIYGQEVNDFNLLKKESIFTVATAALQEVDRQLQAEKRAKAISRHRSFLNKNGEAYASGMIVSSTGTYVNSDSTIKAKINEALAFCKLTDTEKDKGVFGVLAEKNADGVIYKNEERWCINHGGKGGIWVCNKIGGLTNGDYITSSSVPGYGIKQSSDIKRNYTVAKISCNCDFNLTKVAKQKLRTQILTDTDGNDYTGLAYGTSGDVQFDDDLLEGELQMDYEYETRFLEADGTIIATEAEYTTKLNSGDVVFVACFVGCSYCCG